MNNNGIIDGVYIEEEPNGNKHNVCNKRIIYYYQTFADLTPMLQLSPQPLTHIILAAIHFGKDATTQQPYIHLNDLEPDDPQFDNVWSQLRLANNVHGINIRVMIGGAGGAYGELFSNYGIYYKMLVDLLTIGPAAGLVSGVDLDVEEPTELENIRKLIRDLHKDLPDLKFTMAPVAGALYDKDGRGMGGFSYIDLLETDEGRLIEWFNGQFYYGDFDVEHFDMSCNNLYGLVGSDQIVMGTEVGQWAPNDWDKCYSIIKDVKDKYDDMGGVFFWEYYIRPDNWETNVYNALYPSAISYTTNMDSDNMDSDNMDSDKMDSDNMDSDKMDSDNMYIGNYYRCVVM